MNISKARKFLPLVLVFALMFSSCKKYNQSEVDDQSIQNYLLLHNLTAVKDVSGLYYIQTVVGTGVSPTVASTVEIKYKGTLTDGTIFDQTATDKTVSYSLSGLIKGWQIGIPLMKKGGKATFLIPSNLGYGSRDMGVIPPNSVLIFDIELIDVK